MVAARCLSTDDYATIRQTFLAFDSVAPLLMLGIPSALFYFLPRATADSRGVILDNLTLLVIGALVFSLFLALGGYRLISRRFDNPELLNTLPWLILYPLFVMPTAGLTAILLWKSQAKTLASFNLILSLTITAASILAVTTTQSYLAPVLVRVLAPGLFLPIAIYLMLRGTTGKIRLPKRATMTAMLKYAVPLGMATMFGKLTLQLHALVVASLCTPAEFAVYINGATEVPIVGIVTGSIATVILAEMSDLCSQGKVRQALALFHKACIKSACVLFPTTCFLLVTATPFITVLYSTRYEGSVTPFIIYLFILPIRIVVYGSALMALGMTKSILVRSVFDLAINAVLCVALVRWLGYMGAPIALVITLYLWTTPFNLKQIGRGFGVSWLGTLPVSTLFRVFLVSILSTPLALLGVYGFPLPPIGQLLVAGALYWPAVVYLLHRGGFIVLPKLRRTPLPLDPRSSQ